jgi:CNT family concentrative nucleoside transporter
MSTDITTSPKTSPGASGPPETPVPPHEAVPPTPFLWRVWIALAVAALALLAYFLHHQGVLTLRGQAAYGVVCMLGMMALFSANLRAVNWRTIGFGFAMQVGLALLVLQFGIPYTDDEGGQAFYRPVYELFDWLGTLIARFMSFAEKGARFVFGPLADPAALERAFGERFIFAFTALPTIIFVSSFFTVLYHFGILQFVVRVFARAMQFFLRTSGAETLSAAANVFMGQTEAPLIIKPYVPRMTQSELLALMGGGMATISGSLLAVYISLGADPVAILTTSVMAAPASLFLAKLVLPELEQPETRGRITAEVSSPHRNVIDAAAGGASDGLFLALNVAAMLIAFIAFVELINVALQSLPTGQPLPDWLWQSRDWYTLQRFVYTGLAYIAVFLIMRKLLVAAARRLGAEGWLIDYRQAGWWMKFMVVGLGYVLFLGVLDVAVRNLPENLDLRMIFSWLFSPLAFFMGVEAGELDRVANLLGTKLATNEFVAYLELSQMNLSQRSTMLATFALTGFANFASIGIQLGGIGAMAPERRPDLARLGLRALLVGYMATVLNAALAGVLLPSE